MHYNMTPTFEQLKDPLPVYSPKSMYYSLIGLFLKTFGRLSEGINRGFAYGFDSGMIMNYIYNNKPQGRFYIGKVMDRLFLNQITCKAFRSIKQIQIDFIKSYILERGDEPTFIVDLASGKADYIYETLKTAGNNVEVLLSDIDQSVLDESRGIAGSLNLEGKVRFQCGDALDVENLRKIGRKPDLLVEVGLYGIIHDDALIREHLLQVKNILTPGAILFNVQTQNPQIEMIARSLRNQKGERCVWHLRPVEDVVKWAEEAGFRNPRVTMDPYDIYAVVLMRG